jgi:hypothetical protein
VLGAVGDVGGCGAGDADALRAACFVVGKNAEGSSGAPGAYRLDDIDDGISPGLESTQVLA